MYGTSQRECKSSTRNPEDELSVCSSPPSHPQLSDKHSSANVTRCVAAGPENSYRVLVVSRDLSFSRLGLPRLAKLAFAIPGHTDTLQGWRVVKTLTSL